MDAFTEITTIPALAAIVYTIIDITKTAMGGDEKFRRFIPLIACVLGAICGVVAFYFVPGELYIEPGMEILENSTAACPIISTLSNGNGQYFFTEKSGEKYPAIDCKAEKLFGFYEIYSYMHQQRFKYQNSVASFIVEKMASLENVKEM